MVKLIYQSKTITIQGKKRKKFLQWKRTKVSENGTSIPTKFLPNNSDSSPLETNHLLANHSFPINTTFKLIKHVNFSSWNFDMF